MTAPRRTSTAIGATVTTGRHLKKRSLTVAGHPTSLALEPAFWAALDAWAAAEERAVSEIVSAIDAAREEGPLASAVRVAVLQRALHYQIPDGWTP